MLSRWNRFIWDMERFGLTPRKILARLTNRTEPRILCISVPKAGTHLLERVLCLHPRLYRKELPTLHSGNIGRFGGLDNIFGGLGPGQILVSHLWFSRHCLDLIRKWNIRAVFIIRDPRDVVISRMFYVSKNRKHYAHRVLAGERESKARLRLSIAGFPQIGWPSIGETLRRFEGWLNQDGILLVRFEDLVHHGSRLTTLRAIYQYIGLDVSDGWLFWLSNNLVSQASSTFREGRTGYWRELFDDEIKRLFKEIEGGTMVRYGYEAGNDW